MKIVEMEVALMRDLNFRANIIVPNISWGLNLHECDLLVVRRSGLAVEVEIKTSIADFKKDFTKKHRHSDHRISQMYWAFPEEVFKTNWSFIESMIDPSAGVLIVKKYVNQLDHIQYHVETVRNADMINRYKWTEGEKMKLLRLGTIRNFGLKKKIMALSVEKPLKTV